MKKKIFSAALCGALMTTILTGCGNGDRSNGSDDTTVSRAVSDTIIGNYASMVGMYVSGELNFYAEQNKKEYNKDYFFEGVKSVLSENHPDEYYAGVSTALRLLEDLKNMEALGVQVDRRILLESFHKSLMTDSIDRQKQQEAQAVYESAIRNLQTAAAERAEARMAESPEAIKNAKTAEAFVNSKLKTDPEMKKTASGIYYKIEAEGTGNNVGTNDRATVNYVGTHIDGKVFDRGNASKMTPGNGLIPGYAEALQLLKTGGKGTFYIPAELAYGVKGAGDVIGPNEMLVFRIEVLEIEPDVLK